MNAILKKFKDVVSENCITIIMNTHRTKPDYLTDGTRLKNLIKEAENKLQTIASKQDAAILIDRLNDLAR